jgi:hypothetical protein
VHVSSCRHERCKEPRRRVSACCRRLHARRARRSGARALTRAALSRGLASPAAPWRAARSAADALALRRGATQARLVAVSKTKPVEALREAYDAGQRDFGEN